MESSTAQKQDTQDFIFQNLKKSRYFVNISDEALYKLTKITEYRTYDQGEVIMEQDKPNQMVFIIVKGRAAIKVDGNFIYHLQRIGDIFGEMSVITGNASSASIEAESRMELICISAEMLNEIADDTSHELHHIFYKWFAIILSEKLVRTSQKAKLHEESQKALEEKTRQQENHLREMRIANEVIQQAYEDLINTKVELEETKRVAELTETFKKFVPEQFVNKLDMTEMGHIEVGRAENDFITILFSDIRNFTTFSEALTAQEVFRFLNSYFKRMSKPIHKYEGFIDKFIGDAIMAIFNIPEGTDEMEAHNAMRAAIEMQAEVLLFNKHRKTKGYQPVHIGIGVHSGPVMMGTVGSDTRMDFTVIGDTVNLASRLESLTKIYGVGIILSHNTFMMLDNLAGIHWRELDMVKVKGKTEPVVIFEVFSENSEPQFQQKLDMMEHYHQGLILYRMHEWGEAIAQFHQCLRVYPSDQVAQTYIQRCETFKAVPPQDDEDLVIKLDHK